MIMVILPMSTAAAAGTKPQDLPFHVGEELVYTVRWEMVSAGKAVFKVLKNTSLKDQKDAEKVRHFNLELKSNAYVDMLFKIRDRMQGFSDLLLTRSEHYSKVQSGKEKRQIEVAFDWEQKNVVYSNFGGKRDPVAVPEHTFDPLSSLYKMRTVDFKPGQTLSFPVTDGKKVFIQKAHVRERQTLFLGKKSFDTYLIMLEVNHFSGVFKKSKDPTVRLWVTADKKKIPVRIKIKVFIGSVIFDLKSVT